MNKAGSSSQVRHVVIIAVFITIEIILTRFLSLNIGGYLRIGFGFLPIALLAALYGPLPAGIAYAVGDILGMLIFPSGTFFPGFTLSAFITGLIWGNFLYRHEVGWKRTLAASTTITVLVDMIMNTLWLSILLGKGYMVLLIPRIVKCAAMIPVHVVLIPLLWRAVFRQRAEALR